MGQNLLNKSWSHIILEYAKDQILKYILTYLHRRKAVRIVVSEEWDNRSWYNTEIEKFVYDSGRMKKIKRYPRNRRCVPKTEGIFLERKKWQLIPGSKRRWGRNDSSRECLAEKSMREMRLMNKEWLSECVKFVLFYCYYYCYATIIIIIGDVMVEAAEEWMSEALCEEI